MRHEHGLSTILTDVIVCKDPISRIPQIKEAFGCCRKYLEHKTAQITESDSIADIKRDEIIMFQRENPAVRRNVEMNAPITTTQPSFQQGFLLELLVFL